MGISLNVKAQEFRWDHMTGFSRNRCLTNCDLCVVFASKDTKMDIFPYLTKLRFPSD